MLLSETKVRHAKPAAKDQWLRDGAGLYLRVRAGGSKVWVIRRKRHGKTSIITLGQYPLVVARLTERQDRELGGVEVADVVAVTFVPYAPPTLVSWDRN
jgi:hypothetical protein